MSRTVCFDTNVLIDLSNVYYNHPEEAKDLRKNFYKHYKTLLHFLKIMRNEKIKILVLPMVLFEVAEVSMRNNYRTLEFLNEFRNVIKVVTYKHPSIKNNLTNIDTLAETYCKESTVTKNGKMLTFNPVFKNINNKPSWDAIIMAQATMMGSPLITRDWDFLDENKPVRIKNINKFFANKTVRPYSCQSFLSDVYQVNVLDYVSKPQLVIHDEAMAYV